VHGVGFSPLDYAAVIFTFLCAYLDTVLTNRNEWIPGIVKRITNSYFAYSYTKGSTILRGKQ